MVIICRTLNYELTIFYNQCVHVIDGISENPLSPTLSGGHQAVELGNDSVADEVDIEKLIAADKPKAQNYISHSVIALRSRVMPPPCIRNPYIKDTLEKDTDVYGNQRSKYAGTVLVSSLISSFILIFVKNLLQHAR